MPSYVITGASRGLGFEFCRQLAQTPGNTVIGLVRNKAAADTHLQSQGVHSVTMLEADYSSLPSLQHAASQVQILTGGSLDYLINNAALVSSISEFKSIGDFDDDFSTLEADMRSSFEVNVVSVLKIVHAFLPLIQAGSTKKVITISTGMADIDMINEYEIAYAAPYSVSKAAVNALMAKYNALYKSEGILFLSVSPGYVATERNGGERSDEEMTKVGIMVSKFAAYAPHFTRPLTPEESVRAVLGVAEKASLEGGSGGLFVSHLGTKQWL